MDQSDCLDTESPNQSEPIIFPNDVDRYRN